MRKWLVGIGVGLGAVALVLAGALYAASTASSVAAGRQANALASGMMRRWTSGRPAEEGRPEARAQLQNGMLAALGDRLGLPADDLSAKLSSGQTLGQIAAAQGLSQSDLKQALEEAWSSALHAAVSDGRITQAQADWMEAHPGWVMLAAAMGRRAQVADGWGNGSMWRGLPGRW